MLGLLHDGQPEVWPEGAAMTPQEFQAKDLKEGDVLLDSEGKPAFVWSEGTPKVIRHVEHIVRITFGDYRHAEFPADHVLDVERKA